MPASRFDEFSLPRSSKPSEESLSRLAALLTYRYANRPLVVREERLAWEIYPSRFVADGGQIRVLGAHHDGYRRGAAGEDQVFEGEWSWRRLLRSIGLRYAHLHLNRRLGERFVECMGSERADVFLADAARGYKCWIAATLEIDGDHRGICADQQARTRLRALWKRQASTERTLIHYLITRLERFVRWPLFDFVLMPVKRGRGMHDYPDDVGQIAKNAGIRLDRRSNGPAIAAYELAGGERPTRANGHGWTIHHIYDGNFPFPDEDTVLRAVADKRHFTHSAGLVAIHAVADAMASESPFFAWWLRWVAFHRFRYDPQRVFTTPEAE